MNEQNISPTYKETAAPNSTVGAVGEQPLSPKSYQKTRPFSNIPTTGQQINSTPDYSLKTIDGKTLMSMDLPELSYCVNPILPHGLFVLAGPPKVGKTWLVQQISYAVATGTKLWEFPTNAGDVLYLALEDSFPRLQNRFSHYESHNGMEHIHFVLQSRTLETGLLKEIYIFIKEHPNTQLVVIDTLQHVRNRGNGKNMYADDYESMNKFRELFKRCNVTIILVTHTRKMEDNDPVNMITGSTGISGGADGMWVLLREKRTENNATLTISNRDTQSFEFALTFDTDNCSWVKKERYIPEPKQEDYLVPALLELLSKSPHWQGTSTQLLDTLCGFSPKLKMTPATLAKKLREHQLSLHESHGILFSPGYCGKDKIIKLDFIAQC